MLITMSADTTITEDVQAALAADPHLHNPAEVAVSEQAGTVVLRGTVRSLHQRRLAVETAKSVRGVRDVMDEIAIDPRDHWDDAEVRGAALQALIASDAVPSDHVDVSVTDGWLTLTGRVKHQSESNAAFEAVTGLPGVGGITNRIEVVTAG
jgi:osmotically-inducible protein OsmY